MAVSTVFYMSCKSVYVFTLCCVLCHCGLVLIIMLFLCLVSLFHVFDVFGSCVITCNLMWQCLQCFICLVKLFMLLLSVAPCVILVF